MKSLFGTDYSAGYLPEVPKETRKAFKKAKINLSKKAYVIFPYDEKGEPAFPIIIDGDTAYIVIEGNVFALKKSEGFKTDDLILVSFGDFADVVALEADAEYYKLSPEGSPNTIALAIIHEELGLRHFVMALSDMIELRGEEKDKFITQLKEFFEKENIDMTFEPKDFTAVFVEITPEEEKPAEEEKEEPEQESEEYVEEEE